MGKIRQEHYLEAFHNLEPGGQKALLDIYHQAHQGGEGIGRHVVMAMIASVRYPGLFKFTMSNIVVRLLLKRFHLEGDWRKALQMQEVLDDFHVALDQFVAATEAEPLKSSACNLAFLHPLEVWDEIMAFKGRSQTSVNRVKQARA